MDTKAFFDEHLLQHPVMGIFRGLSTATTVELCEKTWGPAFS